MIRPTLLSTLVGEALSHAAMLQPIPRGNWGAVETVDKKNFMLGCLDHACDYFHQGCIPGCVCDGHCGRAQDPRECGCKTIMDPTHSDVELRTWNIENKSVDGDWTKFHPWRAPGHSILKDPCGLYKAEEGMTGSELPVHKDKIETWTAGGTAWAWWALWANHGGGYQYRLCPKSKALSNECFEANPLEFATDKYTIRYEVNSTREDDVRQATQTNSGTKPAGSTWRRNPIPGCNCDQIVGPHVDPSRRCQKGAPPKVPDSTRSYEAYDQQEMPEWYAEHKAAGGAICDTGFQFPPPAPGVYAVGGANDGDENIYFSIGDELQVPKEEGAYVLQWRWDCEESLQVWTSCADIEIVAPTAVV